MIDLGIDPSLEAADPESVSPVLLAEEAPDAPGAEEWIQKHKDEFKRRYGQSWAHVLYGKAWHIFGKRAKNASSRKPVREEAIAALVAEALGGSALVEAGDSAVAITISGPVGGDRSAVAGAIMDAMESIGVTALVSDRHEADDAEDGPRDGLPDGAELSFQYESGAPSPDLTPPPAVRAAAKRGLELRREHGRGGWDSRQAHAGGMGSGVVRAQTLAAGRKVSLDTVRRMRSFFARHDGERERAARQRDETSAANIAWLLWGGDPGRKWAEEVWARRSVNEQAGLTEAAWWDKFVRRSLTREESAELKVSKVELDCSVMHFTDKKGKELGFRAYTHRAASKFYPRVSDIPEKVLRFVSSTG